MKNHFETQSESSESNSEPQKESEKEYKFQIKVVSAWFSDDYVNFYWSYGKESGYILNVREPIDWKKESYVTERLTFKLGNGNFTHELNVQWNTYEKVIAWNNEIEAKVKKLNEQRNISLEKYRNDKEEAKKRAGIK
jgi:hypothetical protein